MTSHSTREEALRALRTLISYIGDTPGREGLRETPERVLRHWESFFSGYRNDPEAVLSRTFGETGGYRGMVCLSNIRLDSYCEHHILPVTGRAHVAYLPVDRVAGISKLARVVDIHARRLQIQERLTTGIAGTIMDTLRPRGVAVMIEASHQCMTIRGVEKADALMTTTHFTGDFLEKPGLQEAFMTRIALAGQGPGRPLPGRCG